MNPVVPSVISIHTELTTAPDSLLCEAGWADVPAVVARARDVALKERVAQDATVRPQQAAREREGKPEVGRARALEPRDQGQ